MINEELCDECKKFDELMNGGSTSFDVLVVCDHKEKCIGFYCRDEDGTCPPLNKV